jgi:prophage regulatory protein
MENTIKERRQRASQPLDAANNPDALLKISTVVALSGKSEPTLRRRAKTDPALAAAFVRDGPRCTRLRAGIFMAWLRGQGAAPADASSSIAA